MDTGLQRLRSAENTVTGTAEPANRFAGAFFGVYDHGVVDRTTVYCIENTVILYGSISRSEIHAWYKGAAELTT